MYHIYNLKLAGAHCYSMFFTAMVQKLKCCPGNKPLLRNRGARRGKLPKLPNGPGNDLQMVGFCWIIHDNLPRFHRLWLGHE